MRKAGPTRQADKGRDLLLDLVPDKTNQLSGTPSTEAVRVVAQAKAVRETVGKSHVRDIRDTVEHHEAAGYFLIVSSQLSSGLIEQLETLRKQRGWHIDWWTRSEIELRLRRHVDILERFGDVIRAA